MSLYYSLKFQNLPLNPLPHLRPSCSISGDPTGRSLSEETARTLHLTTFDQTIHLRTSDWRHFRTSDRTLHLRTSTHRPPLKTLARDTTKDEARHEPTEFTVWSGAQVCSSPSARVSNALVGDRQPHGGHCNYRGFHEIPNLDQQWPLFSILQYFIFLLKSRGIRVKPNIKFRFSVLLFAQIKQT
ncbi:hypothetical protein CDL15_Pgr006408 [Punica granatum]|uniref:Uncharacterized protein n=1 Tax=Punica granatum TaxID=22663 RepID=A0A218VUZ3_PUNGR|nr:hypothetical protein CDL15_Pgr006408 [Punica granatum]